MKRGIYTKNETVSNKLIKFKPVILDLFSSYYRKMFPQSVYHVTESDSIPFHLQQGQ